METICLKCQNLFPGKNKKNVTICHLLKILPTVLGISIEENVVFVVVVFIFFAIILHF